jgi:tRNA uridine 5-carboxymethylaminomethyl modification enzyme
MFTSRAEYRLLLRHDNADLRLTDIGHRIGLVPDDAYSRLESKRIAINDEVQRLKDTRPRLTPAVRQLIEAHNIGTVAPTQTLAEILRRQDLTYEKIVSIFGHSGIDDPDVVEAIQLEVKYEGYVKRQLQQIDRSQKLEHRTIPALFDYDSVSGFSTEVREKLKRVKPASIGQASRISGITPAAISLLLVSLERFKRAGPPEMRQLSSSIGSPLDRSR